MYEDGVPPGGQTDITDSSPGGIKADSVVNVNLGRSLLFVAILRQMLARLENKTYRCNVGPLPPTLTQH